MHTGTINAENGGIVVGGGIAPTQPKSKKSRKTAQKIANRMHGVFKIGNRWKAQGGILGVKKHYIGTFKDKESAARAVAAYERGEKVQRPPRMPRIRSINEFRGKFTFTCDHL
jgi:hypothetical protein